MPYQPEDRMSAARPGEWAERGACLGLEPELADRLFFPGQADHAEMREAKRICATCPVKTDCLEFAVTTNQDCGIWGGTSEAERRRIRRRRRRLGRLV